MRADTYVELMDDAAVRANSVEMLRDLMLENAQAQFGDGNLARLAAEVAEHKRDPYTLVEEIAANSVKR